MRHLTLLAFTMAVTASATAGTYLIVESGFVTNVTSAGTSLTGAGNTVSAAINLTIHAHPSLRSVTANPSYVGEYRWKVRFIASPGETPNPTAFQFLCVGHRYSSVSFGGFYGVGGTIGGVVQQQDSTHALISAWSTETLSKFTYQDVTWAGTSSGSTTNTVRASIPWVSSGWTQINANTYEATISISLAGSDQLSATADPASGFAQVSVSSIRGYTLTLAGPNGTPLGVQN
ncbi:MAG: hypothetical protein SFX74_02025 [Fimbriimonadaceae bacterium]|nr:hypothetical protein [Fimbriimonadaceae bacterium]